MFPVFTTAVRELISVLPPFSVPLPKSPRIFPDAPLKYELTLLSPRFTMLFREFLHVLAGLPCDSRK